MFKKIQKVGLFFVLPFIVLAGCSNQSEDTYNHAIEDGLDSLIMGDYRRAEDYFNMASEDADDDKASQLLKQTEFFKEANDLFEDREYDDAINKANKALEIDEASYALRKKSKHLVSQINKIKEKIAELEKQLEQSESLMKEKKYEEALTLLEETFDDEEIDESYYGEIKGRGEAIKEKIIEKEEEQAAAESRAEEKRREKEEKENSSEFDELALEKRVLMAASIVDDRIIDDKKLEGFTLYYTIRGDQLFVNLHSGVGSGHPVYKIQMGSESFTPIDGFTRSGMEDFYEMNVNQSPVKKEELYQHYLQYKDAYDIAEEKVEEEPGITVEQYKELKAKFR